MLELRRHLLEPACPLRDLEEREERHGRHDDRKALLP